jgi:hypothetical protein
VSKIIRKPAAPTLEEMKVSLQKHQIARLTETFADLKANERYRALAEFFFVDLYFVGDRKARNESFLRVWRHFEKVLGGVIVAGLHDLVEFYLLSERLDDDVARVLVSMKAPLDFDRATYERAYRYADDFEARKLQLEYVGRTLDFVHRTSQRRLLGVLISTMQATARLIGASLMADFLNRGYTAFREVKDITYFRDTILKREHERLERIWREVPLDEKYQLKQKSEAEKVERPK